MAHKMLKKICNLAMSGIDWNSK